MLRALVALIASLLAGGGVVQILAVASRGSEVFIMAFFAVVLAAVLWFPVALFARRGIDGAQRLTRASRRAVAVLVVAALMLLGYEALSVGAGTLRRNVPLILALIGGPLVAILAQWAILRRK